MKAPTRQFNKQAQRFKAIGFCAILIVCGGMCCNTANADGIVLVTNQVVSTPSNVAYDVSFNDWIVFGPVTNSYSSVSKTNTAAIGDLVGDITNFGTAAGMGIIHSWTGGNPVATASSDSGGRFAPVGLSYAAPRFTSLGFDATMIGSSTVIEFYAKSYYMTSVLVVATGGITNTFDPGFPLGADQYRRFQVAVTGATVSFRFTNFVTGSTWANFAILSANVPPAPAGAGIGMIGTNGAAIASGEAASAVKGTDFGSLTWGQALTNTLRITNSGVSLLTISGVTTNGAGASAFLISDPAGGGINFPFLIEAGGVSNFTVKFAPAAVGVYTAAVIIANDSTNASPFSLFLAGTGAKQSQAALTFAPTTPQTYNTTNVLSMSGGSGTGAVSYTVLGGPGQIVGATNLLLATCGTGVITMRVDKATDNNYLAAAATAEVACAQAGQTITFPAIPAQHQTNVVGLSATASSGLPVSFSVTSGPGVITGGTNLSFTATGVVMVAASQAGDANWSAAANVINTINVSLPVLVMLGTNGAALAENENASQTKGTDFGAIMLYAAVTNTLVVSNAGIVNLTIGGVSTSGAGALSFSITNAPATVAPGSASNLSVVFHPAAMGSYTATLSLANSSTPATFRVNLAGSVSPRVVWTSTPVTNATDGELYTYTLQGFDPLGRDLSFFAQSLPAWLSIVQTGGSYIVSTVAGNGTSGSSGDGGAATNANLSPYGICMDAAGNFYVSDNGYYRVRKVTASNGIISTYAGKGTYGYSGDGGPATNAKIQYVYGLSADSQTNVYLADNGNYRVRKVTAANGIISTFAGKGTYGYSGDGGPATNAAIYPYGIYADTSNRLWVMDYCNYRIRRVTGGVITTVAGNGNWQYNGEGLAGTNANITPCMGQLNTSGEFIFTDNSNYRIRRMDTNGLVYTITMTTNLALITNSAYYYSYYMTRPGGLSLDQSDNIYFTLPNQHQIYRIAAGTTNPVLIAGNPVIPTNDYYYYRYIRSGYSGDGGSALQAQFNYPQSLCVDAQGNVYVADQWNYRVRKLTPSGGGWVLRGTPGPGDVGPTNITLYVSNGETNTPQSFTLTVGGRARPALKGADGQIYYDNAAASAAAGTDFGTVGTNESQSMTLAITNYGTADLVISGVATSGSGANAFSISDFGFSIEAGGVSNFTVSFAPNALGTLLATFALTNNGTNTPFRVNVAGCGVKPGEIGLNKSYLTYTAVYGGANPAAQTWVLTNKGATAFSFSNAATYGSGAGGWLTVRPSASALNSGVTLIHTGSVNIAGLNAGIYYATNTIYSPTAINSPVGISAMLEIGKAAQNISFTSLATQMVSDVVGLSATANSGLPVSFSVTSGLAQITGGTNLSFTGEGFVTLLVSQTGNVNYAAAVLTNTFRVVKGESAVFIVGALSNVYDGAVKSVTATTMPAGLSVTITYDDITNAPSNAGSYDVLTRVLDTNYSGSANATLTISKAPAAVYLGGLSNVYDGTVKSATATTVPAGIATELRYDGSLDAPSNAGSYTVTGLIADGNYSGGATGTMTIAKANQTITFPAIPDQYWTNTVGLFATSSVALPVSFSVVSGPGTITGGTNLSFTGMGAVLVKAQAGDANYNTVAVTNTINTVAPIPWVLGTNGALVTNNAAASLAAGTDFGGILYGTAVTNTLSISNAGSVALTIGGVSTSGAGSAVFSFLGIPATVAPGAASNFSVVFAPTNVGVCTSVLIMAVNATAATYRVNFSGSIGSWPTWTSTPVTNATDGDLYTYTLQGFDPLGHDLSFFAQSLPSWLSIVQTGGSYIVSTVAGNGTAGSSGDGGAATNANLIPYGICMDAAGNLYVSDNGYYRVRKVTASNGIISTYAGNGSWGYSGDGGPATNAKIQYVYGLAADSQTNVYLADNGNYRVRKVAASNGVISTFAGKGTYGYSGDGGPATNAAIYPYGIYADTSDRLWVMDYCNYRIRRVTGGVITTIAGNGNWQYNGEGLAGTNANITPRMGQLNTSGEFIFTDNINYRIRRMDTNGLVYTITMTTNLALITNSAYYYSYYTTWPSGLSLDQSDNIYFTLPNQHQIYRIAAGTTNPVLIAGNPVIPTNDYYYHYYIRGGYSGDGGSALQAQFNGPQSLCVDAQGNIYVADARNYRVRKLTPSGGGWVLRGTPGAGEVGATNITLYVSNGETNTPQSFTLTVGGRARPALKGADGQTYYDNAAASSAAGTDFGTAGTNESQSVTLAITNYGTAALAISGVATSGSGAAYFSISNLPAVVSRGGVSNFTVNFAPKALGTLLATFALSNNGTSTPFRVNVAGCGVKPGEIGLNKSYLTYTAVYGGANPAAQTWVLTNKGATAFSFTNTIKFSSGGTNWFATGPTNGNLSASNSLVHTGSVNIAGINAGTYYATNTITSPTAINAPVDLVAALQIAQTTQTIGFTSLATQMVSDVVGLSATANSGLPVSFSVTSGLAQITGGTNLSFTGEGFVTLLVSQTGNVNYAAAVLTNTFRVVKGESAVFIVGALSNVYDGTVKSVTATTMPAGLSVTITYEGITNAPSNAGSYDVLARVLDTNYSGGANATLTISKAPAAVYLGGLSNVYDGTAKNATATTVPAGIATELRYDGSLDAPSNAGSYTVTGLIADGNYSGGATGTMTIAKANQTITFPAIPDQKFTNTVALSATASSTLPVSFSVVSGPGQINSGTNLTFTAAGQVLVAAGQDGDANWNRAASVTNSITVTAPGLFVLGADGKAIASGAAANTTNGTDFGGVVWGCALTNAFALTNSGSQALLIGGWTTNGAGAASFEISDLKFEIPIGGVSNFTVVFHPSVIGVYTATLVIANNSTTAMYQVNLAGTGAKGTQAPLVFDPASPQAYNTTNTLSASGGSGAGTLSYSMLSGPGQIIGGAGLWTRSGSGMVAVVATKAADDWFDFASATAQVVCARSGQTISFPAIADRITTDVVHLAATANSGLPVSFTVAGGPGQITGGTNLAFTGAGEVSIAAAQAGNTNFNAASDVINTFNVSKAVAAVTLGGLTQTYNGTARSATATTVPPGLTVNFRYNGVTNQPVNVGNYAVTGTVVSALYAGWTNGTLTIGAAPAMVYLTNLNHTYDGTAKSATATTMPAGLSVSVTYNGGASAPSYAGVYAVTARVADVNYSGLTNGILTIARQTQTVSFAAIADQVATGAVALAATASSGLPVNFTVVSGPGQMVDSTNLGFTGAGVVLVRAYQSGNANWNAAAATNTVNVSHAPATVMLTNLTYTYNGAARSATATTVPADLPVTITYNGSAAAPSNAGSYTVTGAVSHVVYAGTNTATLTIARATPAVRFPHIGDQYISRTYGLAATSDSGLPVTFSVINGPAVITGGTNLSFSNTGDVSVAASDAGNANWNAAAATNTFFVHNVLIWFGGTNGQIIANGEAANRDKGTDFGNVGRATVQTNTFTFGNEGTTNLVVTNWTTNGTGAAAFTVLAVATNVKSGGISNIVVRFAPTNLQAFTAAVVFAHNGTTNTPFTLCLSGTGVQAAALGFNVTGVTFTTVYGVNPASQSFAVTNLGQAACAFTQSVTQGTSAWLTVTPAGGVLDDHGMATLTAEASAAGLSAGIYNGTATVYSAVATNSPKAVPVNMIITQAMANVTLGALWQVYDGNARTVTVSTLPVGLTCAVTYDGGSTAPTNAGSYAVTATVSEVNYQGSVTGTLTVARSNVVVNLGNMLQVYDGVAKTASVSTLPEGMAVTVTYDGSATAPSNAGAYAVTALVTEVNFQGSAAGTLTIGRKDAMVYLGGLEHIYDGAAKSATATTLPNGLAVTFTYNGFTNQPVNAGTYAVIGAIASADYSGQANAVLTIAKADQTIFFPNVGDQYWTNRVALSATASSGLPVGFTVLSGPGRITGGTNLTFTEGGFVQVAADQPGDANWNSAETAINSIGVLASAMNAIGTNGALITNGAPASLSAGSDFGGVPWGSVMTNVFAFTNSGMRELLIGGCLTNGPNAAEFVIGGIPAAIPAGGAANIFVAFRPATLGAYSAVLVITNNTPCSPFVMNLAGTGAKQSQTAIVFNPASPQTYNTTQTLGASGGSGTGAVSYAVASGPGQIVDSTKLQVASGTGIVTVVAARAADALYNQASATAIVACAKAGQTITFPAIPDQNVTDWLTLSATADSGLAVTFAVGSGPATISATVAVFSATGQVSIVASQAGDANWSAAPTVTRSFQVIPAVLTTNLPVPQVSATEGDYTNRVRVIWTAIGQAAFYELFRATTNNAAGTAHIATVSADASLVGNRIAGDRPDLVSTFQGPRGVMYAYDDYTVVPAQSYYYWVRARNANDVSPLSYVGVGYAALTPDQATATSDLEVYDFVYLPILTTNSSAPGTISMWLVNHGPDALTGQVVRFDFALEAYDGMQAWEGSVQQAVTLASGSEVLMIMNPEMKQTLHVRPDLAGRYRGWMHARHVAPIYDPNLSNNTVRSWGAMTVNNAGRESLRRGRNDYDGDGKSDGCLYQSAVGRWYVELSGARYGEGITDGDVGTGLMPVAGDYDGDGLTDFAVYNRLNGQWVVKFSSSGLAGELWLGDQKFTATQCDFDGDALTDPMVYRDTDGCFRGAASTRQYAQCEISLNAAGYQAVRGDFDGDGKGDPAAYSSKTGSLIISLSRSGYQIVTGAFGEPGCLPAPADYDGDGKTDPAVYDPGTAYWQILMSASLETQGRYTWWGGGLGSAGGLPISADYDGDGLADPAVYHQDTGLWELFPTTQGYQLCWGLFGGPAYQPALE